MEKQKPPIKVGDKLKIGITKFGSSGDPMMTYKGFVIFLKDIAKRGFILNELIEIKIIKLFPNYAFAERTK